MAVRPIDGNELYRIEKLLDTDIVRQDKVALNLLEQVLYDIQHVPTLTPPNEWVSVENAVPDPGERVLATDGTFVGEAYRTSANTWYRHTGFPWRDCLQSIVTLWMPLPTADKDNHVPAKALVAGFKAQKLDRLEKRLRGGIGLDKEGISGVVGCADRYRRAAQED